MPLIGNYLLSSLHKWACDYGQEENGHSKDENFTTDAFAHLLNRLCKYEASVAVKVMTLFGCQTIESDLKDARICTQIRHDKSQPDIEIDGNDFRVFIEVKVDCKASRSQIERHREALARIPNRRSKALVLLTKNRPEEECEGITLLRWYEVANLISNAASRMEDKVSKYLAQQFVEFLRERGMTMDKIERGMTSAAITPFTNLLTMLKEAIPPLRESFPSFQTNSELEVCPDSGGRYFGAKKDGVHAYWVGIFCRKPEQLVFAAYGVDSRKRQILKEQDWEYAEEGNRRVPTLRKKFDLKDDFFTKSGIDQKRTITKFLSDSINEI